ncbi:MAG: MATE family efflux transporter [Lawsonibacter sp.]
MRPPSCLREYARYCSLNIFGMLALSCYILADTFFVANGLGADGLAALNLALPVYSLIHGSGLMLGMGGAPMRSMLAMVSGSLSNILLDYLFLFPLNMGMFGAVFATGLAPIISMAVLASFFLRRQNGFHPVSCRPSLSLGRAIAAAGVPSLVTEVSSGLVILVFNAILLRLQGNLGVAAYAVVANLSLVVFSIYTGIAQGTQPLLSGYYGSGCRSNIRAVLRYAVVTVLVLSTLLYTLMFLEADSIVSAFNREQDPALQAMAVWGLKLYFIACPCVGLNIVLSVYFTSTEVPRPAHVISLLRGFFLILPLSFLLSQFWGMNGLWLTFPITEWLVAGVAILFYLRTQKGPSLRGNRSG